MNEYEDIEIDFSDNDNSWYEEDDDALYSEGYYSNRQHYSEYNGYMGYSDEAIDDAFEGDPSNVWNVL